MTASQIHDPKGLMKDAFSMEGVTAPECRSIFLDWALGLPAEFETRAQVQSVIAAFEGRVADDHPMLATLREGLAEAPQAKRRGGRQKRLLRGSKA